MPNGKPAVSAPELADMRAKIRALLGELIEGLTGPGWVLRSGMSKTENKIEVVPCAREMCLRISGSPLLKRNRRRRVCSLRSTRSNTTRRSISGLALERIQLAQVLEFREQLKGGYGRTNRFSELVNSLG